MAKKNSKGNKRRKVSDQAAQEEPASNAESTVNEMEEEEEKEMEAQNDETKGEKSHQDDEDDGEGGENAEDEQGEESGEEEQGDEDKEDEVQEGGSDAKQDRIQEPITESDGKYRNKQRCLALCTRGVTARYRHLLEDLRTLMPHHKKESKLDPGDAGVARAVTDIAEMRSCNTVLFLECRKRQDCYLWLGRIGRDGAPPGPSVKFHVSNVHTMDELKLTGNCMKGSRPVLSFDESFGRLGHLKLLKELFVDIFGTPRGHPKSKPFVDRVMCFYYADKRIWVRNYQIVEEAPTNALELHQTKKATGQDAATSLVEIGPRFVLNPIRIFRGLFGGQTLYQNPDFVSPNQVRAMERKDKGHRYEDRKRAQKKRKEREERNVLPEDPLDSVFRGG